jgi:peroxiredoxin
MTQAPPPALDIGPAVGESVPRFEARDQAGRLRTFEDLKGPNGLVLLFFRSADW